MEYRQLDETSVAEYVSQAGLFDGSPRLQAREVGDGNLNLVFRVHDVDTGQSVIVKQALPYLRVAGEGWPLGLERTRIEADALEIQNRYAPGLVPRLYHRNDDLALIAMEDLSRLELMRRGMIAMHRYPRFAEHISTFMANMLFFTSDLHMKPADKKRLVGRFINPDLCKITEDLIFTDPYYDAPSNKINPALRPYLESTFWKKTSLRLEASKLKYRFLTEAQSLLHGDLHIGSIFGNEEETKVFDTEFAFVGPSAFDIGLLIGNILINFVSWSGKDQAAEAIADYRHYLAETIVDIYLLFEKKFLANWEQGVEDVAARVPRYRDFYMRNLFVDTIGYAATVMIRRMHGLAHNIDVDGIEDLERRRDVQILVLETAEELMMNRQSFAHMGEVMKLVGDRVH